MINSSMESWRVCLTLLDCKSYFWFSPSFALVRAVLENSAVVPPISDMNPLWQGNVSTKSDVFFTEIENVVMLVCGRDHEQAA